MATQDYLDLLGQLQGLRVETLLDQCHSRGVQCGSLDEFKRQLDGNNVVSVQERNALLDLMHEALRELLYAPPSRK